MKKTLLPFVLLLVTLMSATGQNCSINAGANSTICLGQPVLLDGSVGGPVNAATLQWSLIAQPAGANATIQNQASLLTGVNGVSVAGAYTFRLQATCGDGVATQDEVTVTVNPVPAAPAITGTANFPCYTGDPINLTGTAPGSGETVSWSVINGGTGSFGSPTSNTTTFTPSFPVEECASTSTVTIRYRVISANGCESSTTRNYTFSRNYGLWATANPQQVCGTATILKGSCPGSGTASWTQISGPNTAAIANPSGRTTAATGLVEGSYVFRYTVTGGCSPGTVDVNVTVAGGSAVTQANAGRDQFYCSVPGEVLLTGNQPAVGETVTWSQLSGGTTATFSNAAGFSTMATGLTDAGAMYTFLYKISNGTCFTVDSVSIYRRPELTLTATSQSICSSVGGGLSSSAAITSNYSFRQLDTVKVDITMISGPGSAQALIRKGFGLGSATPVFTQNISEGQTLSRTLSGPDLYYETSNPESYTYFLDFPFRIGATVGVYKFRIRITTSCGTQEKEVTITRGLTGSGINAGTDVALPCNATSATLAGNLANNLGLWSTVRMPAGAVNPINSGNQSLRNPPISGLIAGTYVFRYTNNMGPTCNASQFDEVKLVIANTPPATPNAGADVTACAGSYQLTGSPVPSDAFASWTVVSPASSGVVFSDASVANPVALNLQPNTTYTFRYTLTNGCGNSSDEVTITTNEMTGPSKPAISSTALSNCGTLSRALPGNILIPVTHPALAPGTTATWTVVTDPAGIAFTTSATSSTTTQVTLQNVTQSTVFSIVYTLSSADCPGASVSDTLTGYIRKSTEPSVFSAGPSQQLCSVSEYPVTATLNGSASTGPVLWTQIYSSNGAAATIAVPGAPSTDVTIPADGMYRFKYEIKSATDPGCEGRIGEGITQIMTSTPGPTALAGDDITFCNNDGTTSLQANTVTTGRWEVFQVLKGTAPTIGTVDSPTSTLTFSGSGEAVLRWSSYGSIQECGPSSSDLVKVRYTAPARAGSDQSLCEVTSVKLTAASPAPASGSWTQVSGAAASIADPSNPETLVSGLASGTYTFRFSVDGGPGCVTSDDVTISVSNGGAIANAGSDMATCSGGTNKVQLNATAAPAGVTGTWSVVKTPDGVAPGTFADANDPQTIYTGLEQPGSYVLAWTLADGACTSTDYVELTADDTECSLPVNLIQFTGSAEEGMARLRWNTAAETNFSHFDVEYADRSLNFKPIGRVKSHGTSSGNYTFSYRQPDAAGYYRLRMNDLDATYQHSPIIIVHLEEPEIILFSNPAGAKVRVKGLRGNETLRVYDNNGRLLLTTKTRGQESEISLEGMSVGTYVLEVARQDGRTSRKIFVKGN
ncbi:hypothetical protein GCM10023091_28700 [Ravibacter arvi]|uniref:T9SS type A sorting domain-containing protein n=1 Tax=Ravibacter arvi TaxID=2051041 RepID=A0ABP8M3S2_9BACT